MPISIKTLAGVRFRASGASRRAFRVVTLVGLGAALGVAGACGGGAESNAPGGAPAGGGRGGAPAMPVEVITLESQPVERTGEFVGTVRSRRSTSIQPQAEGFLTRILVESGDRVTVGAPLFEIDGTPQQAAVASLESVRVAREADAAYASQQAARAKSLLDVGATSQQEYEQALTAQKTAEAQLKAVEEQIRQGQAELAYYRIAAPTAGVVGDVPVRMGDRVTRSTVLTTIDDNAGLEIYAHVPVQQAPRLRVGLPIRLLGEDGEVLATEQLSFVAPSVDADTQTVLVKAPLAAAGSRFRTDQFVRTQIVFDTEPGLKVPVVSAMRINGQYFVFTTAPAEAGTVARQRAVSLGRVVGNAYVVEGGLEPGQQLIVSGIQKIGDGSPVTPIPVAAGAGPAADPAGAPASGNGAQ